MPKVRLGPPSVIGALSCCQGYNIEIGALRLFLGREGALRLLSRLVDLGLGKLLL